MRFFRAKLAQDIPQELFRWAERLLAEAIDADVDDPPDAEGSVYFGTVEGLPGGFHIVFRVRLEEGLSAAQYRFALFGPEKGKPRMMWHHHRGHEDEDGTTFHTHPRREIGEDREPDIQRSFPEIEAAISDLLQSFN